MRSRTKSISCRKCCYLIHHASIPSCIITIRYCYCTMFKHSLVDRTTMPQLNIHGDPLPATVDNEVRSALTTSKIQLTAAVVIHIEDPKYVSPKRFACAQLSQCRDDLLIMSRRRRRHGISWGNARVTSHKIHVLRSHIANLGDRWNEVIKQNTIHESLLDFRVPHIVFQDDDPRALDLFLYIVHWNTRMLPQTLTLDELVHLAQLADRYDLNHILINYLDLWLAPHRERILEPGYEQWLYVAWQFGLEEDYLRLANHLTINCAVNAKGQLVPPTSKKPIQGIFPPNALCTFSHSSLPIPHLKFSPTLTPHPPPRRNPRRPHKSPQRHAQHHTNPRARDPPETLLHTPLDPSL
jgi:hypothetical protein